MTSKPKNQVLLTIDMFLEEIAGHTMTVTIKHNDTVAVIQDQVGEVTYQTEILLPTTLVIELSGKDMSCDTVVDERGRITQDKHVKFRGIALDGVYLTRTCLYDTVHFYQKDDPEKYHHNYVGLNSTMTLPLTKDTAFKQVGLLERASREAFKRDNAD